MGTPQFGILTNPYPNRFGDPRTNMGIAFFLFFFSHAQDRRLLTKQTTTQQTLQLSPFLMRGMRRGAPGSSRRALTPRRVGAHPARVGARLRLVPPRRGRNGGGVGSDAVAGGAGADWATCLRLLERRRRRCRSRRCRVDGGVVDACGVGMSLRSGRRTERDKKIEKKKSLLWPLSQTQQPTKNTRTRRRG
jgi:hypothetical protein